MTPRQPSGAPPPGERPNSTSVSRRQLTTQQDHTNPDPAAIVTPTVAGVVEVDLVAVGHGFGLAGAQVVRVNIGSEQWGSSMDLRNLAAATFDSVERVEIVGAYKRAVADAVETLNRIHAQYRADQDDEPDDWPQVGPEAPVPSGAQIAQLLGTRARRAEAVTPVRCTTPGCTTTVSVPHPLPSSLKNVRCDNHRMAAE